MGMPLMTLSHSEKGVAKKDGQERREREDSLHRSEAA